MINVLTSFNGNYLSFKFIIFTVLVLKNSAKSGENKFLSHLGIIKILIPYTYQHMTFTS